MPFVRLMHSLWVALALALVPLQARGAEINLGTEDVVLPAGYSIEPVLTGLSYPTSITFGPDGSLYVAESGYSYGQHWAEARVLKLRPDGRVFPVAGGFRGPIMGLTLRGEQLYVAHRGTISVVDFSTFNRERRMRDIVTGLPAVPNSGHFNSEVTFGPDGKMYFAMGTLTNTGVPGADELLFGWLPDFPWMHDAPARDVTLTGSDYHSPDVLGPNLLETVKGGAFLPFGTPSEAGQVIPAHRLPTSAVYRANADGSGLEVYAWGIRSPMGLEFGPDGRLYMIDHAVDDRGARAGANAPDVLWEIRQNAWYGWPDFIGGVPITDDRFAPRAPTSRRPDFVMQNHPEVAQPLARFEPHAADMKFAWSPGAGFGFPGEMFVAEFGDGAPITTSRKVPPKGYRIVRVNPTSGASEAFMTIQNPGLEDTRGPKRPIDVQFDPAGRNLYLLDFGVMTVRLTGKQIGVNPLLRTGTIWRIRRQGAEGTAAGSAAPADASSPTAGIGSMPVTSVNGASRIRGGRLITWWTARGTILGIQNDMRAAVAHSRAGRNAPSGLSQSMHREDVRARLASIRTQAILGLKKIGEEEIIDDGTRLLLVQVADWADSPVLPPLGLEPDEPMIAEVNRWVREHEFPEKEHLRSNYAVPGRWQRPLEEDIQP